MPNLDAVQCRQAIRRRHSPRSGIRRLQVLHLRHLVDSPGHHTRHRRPGAHHPFSRSHDRGHQQARQVRPPTRQDLAVSRPRNELAQRMDMSVEKSARARKDRADAYSFETPIGEEKRSRLAISSEDKAVGLAIGCGHQPQPEGDDASMLKSSMPRGTHHPMLLGLRMAIRAPSKKSARLFASRVSAFARLSQGAAQTAPPIALQPRPHVSRRFFVMQFPQSRFCPKSISTTQ